MKYLGGDGITKNAVLPTRGEYIAVLPTRGQFVGLREPWRKRGGSVFEGGLTLQCTLCVVSMVDTLSQGDW